MIPRISPLLAKSVLGLCMAATSLKASFVDVQQHFDLGDDRKYWTTTFEGLVTDPLGLTYGFVDVDWNSTDLVYGEVSRYFNIPNQDFMATVQYNGGEIFHDMMQHIGLFGVSYKGLDILYRLSEEYGSDVQVTYVWNVRKGNFEFSGFIDIWTEDWNYLVVLTEPQIWYWLNDYVAVGTEWEISHNFVPGSDDWEVNPTVAVKAAWAW